MKKVPRKITGHPATFHVMLPERCIKSATKEGDIVLDPYMGVGTTAIACINNNRNYIGFEISTTYCDIANRRMQDVVSKIK